ncbi:N66 matrix protein-like [Argiope bruennichi]|nr:N66 matrix protein-like [Argiope bruennichi]
MQFSQLAIVIALLAVNSYGKGYGLRNSGTEGRIGGYGNGGRFVSSYSDGNNGGRNSGNGGYNGGNGGYNDGNRGYENGAGNYGTEAGNNMNEKIKNYGSNAGGMGSQYNNGMNGYGIGNGMGNRNNGASGYGNGVRTGNGNYGGGAGKFSGGNRNQAQTAIADYQFLNGQSFQNGNGPNGAQYGNGNGNSGSPPSQGNTGANDWNERNGGGFRAGYGNYKGKPIDRY